MMTWLIKHRWATHPSSRCRGVDPKLTHQLVQTHCSAALPDEANFSRVLQLFLLLGHGGLLRMFTILLFGLDWNLRRRPWWVDVLSSPITGEHDQRLGGEHSHCQVRLLVDPGVFDESSISNPQNNLTIIFLCSLQREWEVYIYIDFHLVRCHAVMKQEHLWRR